MNKDVGVEEVLILNRLNNNGVKVKIKIKKSQIS